MGATRVRDIMSEQVVTISSDDSLSTVEDIMTLGRVRHMPVVRGGQLVGVVSERDLLRASLSNLSAFGSEQRRAFLQVVEIKRVMSSPPIVIDPDASVEEAALVMAERKIGCLPVVEGEPTDRHADRDRRAALFRRRVAASRSRSRGSGRRVRAGSRNLAGYRGDRLTCPAGIPYSQRATSGEMASEGQRMAVVERVEAAPGERRRLRLANPATLEPLGELEVDDAERRARRGRARAQGAARLGGARASRERGALPRARRAPARRARRTSSSRAIVAETGKPRAGGARDRDPHRLRRAAVLREARAAASSPIARVPLHLLKTKKLRISYRPLGVVGIITPWNFPFILSLNPTMQALIAGNAVVLKPSEVTPRLGPAGRGAAGAAGPAGGRASIWCRATARRAPRCSKRASTRSRSPAASRPDAASPRPAAATLIPCTLELGGKDPMIVCADADLERAARGAVYGAFCNSGQVCTSTERVYVVDEVADEFTRQRGRSRPASCARAPTASSTSARSSASEQLDVIEDHVRDAVAKGARVLAGGRRNPAYAGLFFEPTVLADVTHDMKVMRDETFGPVLPIMRVRDEDEALALANDSPLRAQRQRVDAQQAHAASQLAKAIESGCVVVNDCMLTYGVTESPFGGVKQSGIGRVNGENGLQGYCHTQSIVIDRFGGRTEPLWFPYSARKRELARARTARGLGNLARTSARPEATARRTA